MKCAALLLLGITAALAGGCAGSAAFDPPPGFARIAEPYPYSARAVSPQGVAIAARVVDNEDRDAGLVFWADAIEYQKTHNDGMRLVNKEGIRTSAGQDGRLLQFESGSGEPRLAYWVAVFVTPARITTVECAGPSDLVGQQQDALRAAVRSTK